MKDGASRASITDLEALVRALPADMGRVFDAIYHISTTTGEIDPPEEMLDWIVAHFGSVEAVRQQHIVKVTNRVTMEGALFNRLRSRRPIEAPPGDEAGTFDGGLGGPFCRALTATPADTFGRVKGRACTTASNVAKYDGWHAVIVFDQHHPLSFSAGDVVDYVNTAQEWVSRAHAADPEACYPFFLWNCLWRSGASILHGHAQITLSRGMHYAKVEGWRRAALHYRSVHGSDYFADLQSLHQVLGLATEYGSATVFPSLTPFKEKETHIIGREFDDDFKSALYLVLHTFIERLGVQSFNVALYQPPVSATPEDWEGFPFVWRIIDRGSLSDRTSDVGAMEFFGQSVVATDPFLLADGLRHGLCGARRTLDSRAAITA